MSFRTRVASAGALALAVALTAAACGGDDDEAPQVTATASASPSATATSTTTQTATAAPSATASASATATPWPGESHALSPRYFLYEAADGDTVTAVADVFDATDGPAPAALVAEIKTLNQLSGDALVKGQVLAIPLVLPGDLSLIPENSIESALGSSTLLVQPSLEMRDAFMGKLVLHRVKLELPKEPGAAAGYRMEYWSTDRPPSKGGEPDPEARVSDLQFVVAGGTLAAELQGTGTEYHQWEREGTKLALKSAVERPSAAQLANMLQPASER